MFEAFKTFISDFVDGGKHPSQFADDDYRLAAAALLVHAAAIDGEMTASERDKLYAVIKQALRSRRRGDRRIDRQGDGGRAGIGRPLSFHASAQPRAQRGRPRPHHRNDVADRLCRRPPRRARGQSVVARRRSSRRVAAASGSRCAGASAARMPSRALQATPANRAAGMKPVTLITGASAGIGVELARVFAAHGSRARAGGAARRPAGSARRRDRGCGPAAADGASARSRTPRCGGDACRANYRRKASNPLTWSTMPASD